MSSNESIREIESLERLNSSVKSYDIIGYTYRAEILCPGCIRTTAAFALAAPGEAAFMGRPTDGQTTEEFLGRWAARVGVDPMDEHSYDSDEFPKVVFEDQREENEICSHCGGEL